MHFRGQRRNFPFREEGSEALGKRCLFPWTTAVSREYNFQHNSQKFGKAHNDDLGIGVDSHQQNQKRNFLALRNSFKVLNFRFSKVTVFKIPRRVTLFANCDICYLQLTRIKTEIKRKGKNNSWGAMTSQWKLPVDCKITDSKWKTWGWLMIWNAIKMLRYCRLIWIKGCYIILNNRYDSIKRYFRFPSLKLLNNKSMFFLVEQTFLFPWQCKRLNWSLWVKMKERSREYLHR